MMPGCLFPTGSIHRHNCGGIALAQFCHIQRVCLEVAPGLQQLATGYIGAHRVLVIGLCVPALAFVACQKLDQGTRLLRIASCGGNPCAADIDVGATTVLVGPEDADA